ncbi:MAG: hypothetical protein M3O31_08220, partial [Acidobacteriota bacterium]|nr:hypothetical protein [Acidobacteriota bacterium]
TGVFLRAAFSRLIECGLCPDAAVASLHGIDIEECGVDMCAFVLLVDWLLARGQRTRGPVEPLWRAIRQRLICADSLAILDGVTTTATLFAHENDIPSWSRNGFTVMLGNPPYARLGDRKDLTWLGERYSCLADPSMSTDLYLPFVELLCSQLRSGGVGAMVVPMSIGYGTGHALRRLRETTGVVGGKWIFEFFDRTPDALFGDDVKQRTAIISRVATHENKVITGPIMRWTSRNREKLFKLIPTVDMGTFSIAAGVPKVGTDTQGSALIQLRARAECLGDDLVTAKRLVPPFKSSSDTKIYVAGTAYNWLSIYRNGPAVTTNAKDPSTSSVLELDFEDSRTADASYALLSSRLVYWLWRVEGDAFHVPSGWVSGIPISLKNLGPITVDRLASLGIHLWSKIVEQPVFSVNGGRTTLSYCPHSQPELLKAIDAELIQALGLPFDLGDELARFVRELTVAGRLSISEHGLKRALASWKET